MYDIWLYLLGVLELRALSASFIAAWCLSPSGCLQHLAEDEEVPSFYLFGSPPEIEALMQYLFWLILSLSATYRKDGNLLFPDSFQFPKLQKRIKSCLIHRRFKHWWIFNYSARRQRLVAIVPEGQTLKAGTIHDEHTTVEACTVKITGRTFHWILMLVEKV